MDTKGQLEVIIHQMIASGEKVNVSRVAQKAGVSNALIYNRYPELKLKIQQAKLGQTQKAKQIESTTEIEKLKGMLAKAKQKQEEAELSSQAIQNQNDQLWEHIQQVYSMYDQMLAERNDFAERLKFVEKWKNSTIADAVSRFINGESGWLDIQSFESFLGRCYSRKYKSHRRYPSNIWVNLPSFFIKKIANFQKKLLHQLILLNSIK